jgi:hypothetical protein
MFGDEEMFSTAPIGSTSTPSVDEILAAMTKAKAMAVPGVPAGTVYLFNPADFAMLRKPTPDPFTVSFDAPGGPVDSGVTLRMYLNSRPTVWPPRSIPGATWAIAAAMAALALLLWAVC